MKKKELTTDQFDELFEKGDVSEYIDYSTPLKKENLLEMVENSKKSSISFEITQDLKNCSKYRIFQLLIVSTIQSIVYKRTLHGSPSYY